MFDSPEDARQRDKFPPRERDFGRPRGREDFGDNRMRRDGPSNGYGGGFNKRPFRRDDEPNAKRGRFDAASDTFDPEFNSKDDANAIQPLMTFRKFLMTQEDGVTDNAEAVKKYNEYKTEYYKNALQRFFNAHKNEDWFVRRYAAGKFEERLAERQVALKKRLDVFNDLFATGDLNISLDYTNTEQILHLLDIAVVKLEDGSEEDIEAARNENLVDEAVTELRKLLSKEDIRQDSNSNGNDTKNELHKTASICFKNILPTVSVEELERVCKEHPGFLRLGFSEPIPEQNFVRRAWATYKRNVNVKEIFWALKGVKIGDADLGAAVNRDIRRRIRWVSGLAKHRQVTQNDLKLAAKLVVVLDFKNKLFQVDDTSEPPSDLEVAISKSINPVLVGITDYLIDEIDGEEDALLGNEGSPVEAGRQSLEVDEQMQNALDKIILYLRIVHSFDFYAHTAYPNEDSLPNRLGIMHIRGPLPDEKTRPDGSISDLTINPSEVENYIKEFSSHFESLLKIEIPSEEELAKWGKKDPDKAVEDFIQENTVELGKEKWLCPLSGKKFKGAEFIHKHLTSKHQERLDQERDNAVCYNNYLSDPDRPMDPCLKGPTSGPSSSAVPSSQSDSQTESRPKDRVVMTERNFPRFGGGGGFGGGNAFGRGGGRIFGGERRHQASYRDLDAPEE